MNIFLENAPRYWAAGLSVIPLQPREKKPIPFGWQQCHDTPVTDANKTSWLASYPNSNIGLVLGAQSNITIIDIDTNDQVIIDAILKALPYSPWVRIGAKGMAIAFKYSGVQTFRVDNAHGQRLVEYLSSRTQMVLPPSIHPTTQMPYSANCELLDVLHLLEPMPQDIEDIIRAQLATVTDMEAKSTKKFRYSEKIAAGARDTKLNQHAGYAATLVLRGELSLSQALNNMQAWAEANVERKAGDEVDIEKGCQQIIGYILSDVNTKNKILPNGWDDGLTIEQKEAWGLKFDDSQEEWTVDQILIYIDKVFTEHGKDDPKRHTEIDFILKKLSKSINLNTIDESRILKALKHGTDLTIPTFRNRLKELRQGPIEGLNHTSIAEAAIAELEKKGYTLRYYNEEFWSWEGTHWAAMQDGEIWKLIAREFGDLPAAKKASDHQGIMKVMAQLVGKKIKVIELDGVNFRNGFLTSDLRLIAHSPDFGMTYVMPYSYIPELAGKAFKFENLLHASWGHFDDYEERRRALQEAMAVTLFGKGPSFQRAILLYGGADCGKSQILEIVANMVPEQAKSSLAPDLWDQTFSLSFLHNKLLNIAGELHETRPIPGKIFKELIDGSEITGQFKFKDPFTFAPKATHWFASNHLPKSKDTSKGFNRRWLILSFDRPVSAKDKIVDIGKIIVSEEIEAIVAWAIQCYPEVLAQGGYTEPKCHVYWVRELSMTNSIIRQWMEQRITDLPGSKVKEEEIYNSFFTFCAMNGQTRIIQKQNFTTDFEQFLSEIGKKSSQIVDNQRFYFDISIKKDK